MFHSSASRNLVGTATARATASWKLYIASMPRLAVLLCDIPPAPVLAEEGDYHAIFSNLMRDANPGVDFVFDAYDVKYKLEYPSDDIHYDAMFLSGSGISSLLIL
jgi:hypothetical protein